MKILVSDPLSEKGLEILKSEPGIEVDVKPKMSKEELLACIGNYDALVVRSETKVTKEVIEAGKNLKLIGRAGVGLDNVDVEAASKRGIIVMNTPGGNTISTAEQTMALLLSLSRNIPQAVASLKAKKWDRKKYTGVEVNGKTLGILGLGRIGAEVAKRAQAFGMKVIANDPFIAPERAQQLGVELVKKSDLIKRADYITVHTPLTAETKSLIGPEEFEYMKDGVRIINCARGGIIDEKALYENLKSGKVAGAALDVYEEEPPFNSPLLELENCITTPHLGASTEEAQVNVAIEIAQQVIDALKGRTVRNAINVPAIEPEVLALVQPYLTLGEKLGSLQAQLTEGRIQELRVHFGGEVCKCNVSPITTAVLKGMLDPILNETVNYVNAPFLAKERGIKVIESKSSEAEDFATLVAVTVKTESKESTVVGTLFGKNDPRIVRFDGFHVEMVPFGYIVIITNEDMPGVLGSVGVMLGKHNINIAGLTLGRKEKGGLAFTGLNVDESVPDNVLNEIRKLPHIISARLVKL
ncbi:MAG: phosphoglycerate dehydrogenase [bacterium]|nr:phosphoglycerate dehydrogenase [bacterium]